VLVLLAVPCVLAVARAARAETSVMTRKPPSASALTHALEEAHAWAERAFAKPEPRTVPDNAVVVERRRNHVLKGRTGWDTPLRLGQNTYEHGLFMDTPAAVRVVLAQPADAFTADVGIDHNDDTQRAPDSGSAHFHVIVKGERVLSTGILKLADGATPIYVPLDGAREFTLEVDDGGDGIAHDQCDWANAAVRLADGTNRYLDEFPLVDGSGGRRLDVPFSFTYGGKPSDALLADWQYATRTEPADRGSLRIVSYQDPKSGLLVECRLRTYPDAAAVDWTCFLSNTGTSDTPIVEQFMPLDVADLFGGEPVEGPVTLRWSHGDRHAKGNPTPSSFMPHDEPLDTHEPRRFDSHMTFEHLPFFNLRAAPDGGWITAIGWTGKWTAEFRRTLAGGASVRAGMPRTHFYLRPGERVRTPRILLLRWRGDEMIHGHNQFRRHMLANCVPRLDGRPAEPPVAASAVAGLWIRARRNGLGAPAERFNEQSELAMIERLAAAGCEAYWMDAYWFPQPWWENYGNWRPRPGDFPNGLRPLGDAAHERGLKFILWFATQTAHAGTTLATEHPECFHGAEGGLLKLGDPEARAFMTDWLCARIREWGVDVYREDIVSELPPEPDPNRLGVPEMKHVEGFYQLWADLMARSPGLLIDNCCGGGCKINLDTNCLSYALWRSDLNDVGEGLKGPGHYPRMAMADQVHVAGLSLYVPFHTGPAWSTHPYSVRSAMTSGIVFYEETDDDDWPWDEARRAIAELKGLRPLFQGDLYPLLELTADQKDWYAYQLDRPDLGQGCALFFRRPDSAVLMCDIALYNIEPDAQYEVSITGETYEQGPWRPTRGAELMRPEVIIREKPGSALLRYRRAAD